jgi:predicted flap endonuclease-1-like 5' DNA nuclease
MTLHEAYQSLLTREYKSASAAGKQAMVWKAVEETQYSKVPPVKFSFIYFGVRFVSLPFLSQPFDVTLDVRPPRTKWLHQFGTIAKAEFVPDQEPPPNYDWIYPPFSGLFETGAIGVVRLSLAMNTRFYITGLSLKLFVDGKSSENLTVNPSLDPQDTRNFFELGMTDRLPPAQKFPFGPPADVLANFWMGMISDPTAQSVAHFAKVKSNGDPVDNPRAPYQVFCIPAGNDLMQDPNTTEDFRDLIGKIKPDTALYRLHARPCKDGPWIPIGTIKTTSRFVISEFDDRVLSYRHTRTSAEKSAQGPCLSPPDAPSKASPAAHTPPSPKPLHARTHPAPTVSAPHTAIKQQDYLRRIEGIGPKILSILLEAGITNFSQLAASRVEHLREILADAGIGALADPSSWPEQASLAEAGDWDALDRLQDKLRGGRRVHD